MFNKHKSKVAVLICFLFVTFMDPSSSVGFTDFAIKQQVSESYNKQVDCLAKNIYYEAGNESYEGKLAVAQVTLNRVNSGKFAPDICSVVYQKTNSTCQFSWTCNNMVTAIRDKYQWEESFLIAKRALTQPYLHDIIAKANALYYHAVYVDPGWNKTKVVTRIGQHIFYAKI
jgi:spore germination cell wall hydrolase CwlJ-like protein